MRPSTPIGRLIGRLDPRWGPIWAVGTTTCCVAMALVFGFVGGEDPPPVDHEAQTIANLERRGESSAVIECIRTNGQYDLTAGPLTAVALQQLLSTCRAATATLTGDNIGVDTTGRAGEADTAGGSGESGNEGEGATVSTSRGMLKAELSQRGVAELARLRARCAEGYGADCDRLFELAPADSDDEQFGLTCGDRFAVIDCADLVPEPEVETPTDR